MFCRRFTIFLSMLLLLCCLRPVGAAEPGTWAGFKEEFITAEGRVIDRHQQGISHSEGQGYSMLLAVAFDDRKTFFLLWQWTKGHLQVRKTDALSAWSWGELPNGGMAPIDFNNASDGDICIAWALLLAREKWNLPTLQDEASRILSSIRSYLLLEKFGKTLLLPGYYGFAHANTVTVNPSYLVLPAFKVFGRYGDRVLWQRVYDESLSLLKETSFGRWQLPADWLLLSEDDVTLLAEKPPLFGYEAIRVFLWACWDDFPISLPGTKMVVDLIESSGRFPVTVDLNTNSFSEQDAPGGFIAIAANCARQLDRKKLAKTLWLQAEQKIQQEGRDYYSQVLYLLASTRRIP